MSDLSFVLTILALLTAHGLCSISTFLGTTQIPFSSSSSFSSQARSEFEMMVSREMAAFLFCHPPYLGKQIDLELRGRGGLNGNIFCYSSVFNFSVLEHVVFYGLVSIMFIILGEF